MLSITLIVHSLLRWLVLLTGIAAAARGIMGGKGKAWTAADSRAGLLFISVLDLQLLLGLLLYLFLSPTVRTAFVNIGAGRDSVIDSLAGHARRPASVALVESGVRS